MLYATEEVAASIVRMNGMLLSQRRSGRVGYAARFTNWFARAVLSRVSLISQLFNAPSAHLRVIVKPLTRHGWP
jgi:hypothetical protein